ncbi:MAG: CsgG/HfaB family protein [Blastocatellia bacterium]|nr:CsgG/HfaB family protein [Blastocatellia bacterium]
MSIATLCRLLLLCLLAFSLSSTHVSSHQRKKVIAVLNFDFATVDIGLARQAYGNQENLAITISEKLMYSLVAQNTCVVVERSQLEEALRKQNLGTAGRIDSSTAATVGRTLGADALIIGSVSVFDLQGLPRSNRDATWSPANLRARIAVNYRVVNTTTAVVEASSEATGVSAPAAQAANTEALARTTTGATGGLGGLTGNNSVGRILRRTGNTTSSQPTQVKQEEIRNVVQLAVDDVVNQITIGVEGYLTGATRQPETPAGEKQTSGEIIDTNGPTVFITGLNRATVRIGDRISVRRARVKRNETTGKEIRLYDNIGEVEIIEIQEGAMVGSFSGSVQAREGDLVTNSFPLPAHAGNLAASTASSPPQAKTPTSKTPASSPQASTSGSGMGQKGELVTNPPSSPTQAENSVTSLASSLTQAEPSTSKTPKSSPKASTSLSGKPFTRTDKPRASGPIERFPVIESPDVAIESREIAVTIFLSLDRSHKAKAEIKEGTITPEGGLTLPLPPQANEKPWKIEIVLSAGDFEFADGQNIRTVLLDPLKDSTKALFRLVPKPVTQSPLDSEISATLWHAGDYLGQIRRSIKIFRLNSTGREDGESVSRPSVQETITIMTETVVRTGRATSPEAAPRMKTSIANGTTAERSSAPNILAPSAAPIQSIWRIAFDPKRKTPDLTIRVRERFGKRAMEKAEIEIHSPHLQTTASSFVIDSALLARLQAQGRQLAGENARDLHKVAPDKQAFTNENTDALARGYGRELYKRLAPQAFRKAFWQLVDLLGDQFLTIQIISDNPAIPWEMMRPVREDGTGERGFLGAEFNVGRYHLVEGDTPIKKPPQSLPLRQVSVIAPNYAGKNALAYQTREVAALKKMQGSQLVGGRAPELRRLFANPPQGIIHYSGHAGIVNNRNLKDYSLQLEDGPLNIQAWQGMAPNQLRSNPLFFFNACQIGQAERVANFVDGWAPAVLEAGASGYIGAVWPVNDREAYEFSAKFYAILEDGLKRGPIPIAEVLRRTRESFSDKGSATFLAYVYYGDPNLSFYSISLNTSRVNQ